MSNARLIVRRTSSADIALLASLNHQLIRDEGHRNPMDLSQLTARMQTWLQGEYEASLFECNGNNVGYALYREDGDAIYLRQFFVRSDWRRQGLGRDAFNLLVAQWKCRKPMIRLDVLSNNGPGILFWRALGFRDYCITLELTPP